MDVGILIMGVIFIIMAKVVMDITRKNMKKSGNVVPPHDYDPNTDYANASIPTNIFYEGRNYDMSHMSHED